MCFGVEKIKRQETGLGKDIFMKNPCSVGVVGLVVAAMVVRLLKCSLSEFELIFSS